MATRVSKAPASARTKPTPVSPPVIPVPVRRMAMHVPKAPEIIADRIRKHIVSGKLKVGELLPAESKLMEEYGVSRPTIREAFRILEAERLISVARGARGGALIHAPDPQLISAYTLLVLEADRTTVAEVFNTQRLIEPPLAREIALNGPADAAARLQEKLDLERATSDDIAAFNSAVTGFHQTIVELSGNRPLILMMAATSNVIEKHQGMVMQLARRRPPSDKDRADMELSFRSQKKLIDLIAKRDGAAAETHWARHMDITHRIFVSNFESLTIHELFTD